MQSIVHTTRPLVTEVRDFVPLDHCDSLVSIAAARLREGSFYARDPLNVSSRAGTAIFAEGHPLVDSLERSIELMVTSGSDDYYSQDEFHEVPYITRYRAGQQFRPHFDWIDPADAQLVPLLKIGGQRSITCVVYLSDVLEGGATHFPRLGITVQPRKGTALFFANIDVDGTPLAETLHEGTPVIRGEKWIMTKWIRTKPTLGVVNR